MASDEHPISSNETRTEDVEEYSEDAAWEREQGIPQPDDPFIQQYFNGRDKLILQEEKHRSDGDFKSLLSPLAREAAALVSQIRFEEQQTIWTTNFEEGLAQESKGELYPGAMFMIAKERMEQTKLWKIVKRMPKGALLHCHFEAMVSHDWLFREALDTDGLHLMAAGSLFAPVDKETQAILFVYNSSPLEASTSLWNEDYVPDTPIPIKIAADTFPDGGREGFLKWICSRTSITFQESISHHHGPTAIWRKFNSIFEILDSIVRYEPIFRKYCARLFEQLMDDGVRWVDIRAVFLSPFRREGQDVEDVDQLEFFRIFEEELEKFKDTEKGQHFWGARFIWTMIRKLDNRVIVEDMNNCIAAKLAYPNLIAGYDFVGHEDSGRPLAELLPLLFWFRKQCAEAGVNIPFFFHAGETVGTGNEADQNLFDAILLGTRRIGHGFSLYKHPLLMNMVKDRRICVECCPISNEILRLTSSILTHPLPALLAHGVPVALCNDDPGVLGQDTEGMSHDFYQALQALENLGLEGLGALAENSVRWAAYEDQDAREWTQDVKNGAFGKGIRAKRMREWAREWESFCLWIIVEFGPDLDLDPEE